MRWRTFPGPWFWALLCLAFNVLWHGANVYHLRTDSPEALRGGLLVRTADDASYIVPPVNAMAGRGWRDNSAGTGAWVLRAPGYGLWYLCHWLLFSEGALPWALFASQLLLWCAFVWAFAAWGCTWVEAAWPHRVLTVALAVLPMYSGFLGYTLTEAITPALVGFVLLAFAKWRGAPCDLRMLYTAFALLGILVLVRPSMLMWCLVPVVLVLWGAVPRPWFHLATAALLAAAPTVVWQWRCAQVAGSWQGLHPVYHADATDLYRPLHCSVWRWHKSWGQSAQVFHTGMLGLWAAAGDSSATEAAVQRILVGHHPQALVAVPRDSLQAAYRRYAKLLAAQKPYHEQNRPMPGLQPGEAALANTFERHARTYVQSFPIHSQWVVPLKVYMGMAAHSNLSLYLFQRSWRGHALMEALRWCCAVLHFAVFLLFPFCIAAIWRKPLHLATYMAVGVYLYYLAFVQRGVEERYTLPVLFPMCAVVAVAVYDAMAPFAERFPGMQAKGVWRRWFKDWAPPRGRG
jgi:hypothetical protein